MHWCEEPTLRQQFGTEYEEYLRAVPAGGPDAHRGRRREHSARPAPVTATREAGEGLRRPDLQLEDEDRAELEETITTETTRLERLVTNLIELSRLERALETVDPAAERMQVSLPEEPMAAVVDSRPARCFCATTDGRVLGRGCSSSAAIATAG